MKRILAILGLTLLTTSAFAQPRPPMGPPPNGGGPTGPAALGQYLQLTADQKAAWDAARQDFETATQSLRQQAQAAHQKVHDLVTASSPDPTAIGNAILAAKAIDDQIKAAHDAMETKQESVLTPDQQTKYAAFEAAVAFLQGQHGPGH